MKFINGLFIILFFIMNVYTQERKSIEAHRFLVPPTIDGITKYISFEEIVIIPATKRRNLIDKRAERPSIPSIRLNAFTITMNTKTEIIYDAHIGISLIPKTP